MIYAGESEHFLVEDTEHANIRTTYQALLISCFCVLPFYFRLLYDNWN